MTERHTKEQQQRAMMQSLATRIDHELNGHARGEHRKVGFALVVYEFGNADSLANYVGNASRAATGVALGNMAAWIKAEEEARRS